MNNIIVVTASWLNMITHCICQTKLATITHVRRN